jgi:hypothetical protein
VRRLFQIIGTKAGLSGSLSAAGGALALTQTLMSDKMISEGQGEELGEDDEDLCADAAVRPARGDRRCRPVDLRLSRQIRIRFFGNIVCQELNLLSKLSLCCEKYWHM